MPELRMFPRILLFCAEGGTPLGPVPSRLTGKIRLHPPTTLAQRRFCKLLVLYTDRSSFLCARHGYALRSVWPSGPVSGLRGTQPPHRQ